MKKTVLIYGLVMGAIFTAGTIYMTDMLIYKNPDMESNDLLGYVAMLIIYSLIFFGVRNYRNNQLNGEITFKKAFSTGAMITVVASTLYVVVWVIYYYTFVPDFMDKYTEYVLRHTSPSELEAKAKSMENYKAMYKNPLFFVLMAFVEILPLGLIVSLVSALILKKK